MTGTPDKDPLLDDDATCEGPVPDDIVIDHDRYLYGGLADAE